MINIEANGIISSNQISFEKGKYELNIKAKGTEAYNVFATIHIFFDKKQIGELALTDTLKSFRMNFDSEQSKKASIEVKFDQDGKDEKGHDRDVFIDSISINPIK